MNPMIPLAMLASFVAGGVAAWWYLSPALVDPERFNAQYDNGIRAGRLMAATYLECAAEEVPEHSVDCVMSLAQELRAM